MIKITYFVHGTTMDNENKISSGWKDIELSDLGIKQTLALKDAIKDKKFDIIFCSDLKRAVKSAELIFPDATIVKDSRLRECNYGDYNGQAADVVEPMFEEMINIKFPNGESCKDVEQRITNFLADLKQNYKNKKVAIVSHKAPQLAFEVLINHQTWPQAFAHDWRKNKAWQPGWDYSL